MDSSISIGWNGAVVGAFDKGVLIREYDLQRRQVHCRHRVRSTFIQFYDDNRASYQADRIPLSISILPPEFE